MHSRIRTSIGMGQRWWEDNMQHSRAIRIHTAFLAVLGIACLAPAPVLAQRGVDKGCSPTVANPCTGGSTGGGSAGGGDSIGTILGTELGKALGEALFGGGSSDQTKSRRETALALNNQGLKAYNTGDWATAAAYFQQALQNSPDDAVIRQNLANAQTNMAALQTRERETREREAKDRQHQKLLGNLKGRLDNTELGLKRYGSGTLEMKTGTEMFGEKKVNQAESTAYSKGFEHASQCISQNAGSSCAGVIADQQQSCVADYRAGYDSGSIQRKLVLQEAYQAGHDAAARGELANGASDQRAEGPCRTDWIMSYNNGHFGAKAPSIP